MRKRYEDSSTGNLIRKNRITDEQGMRHPQLDAPVQSTKICKVQLVLGLSWGNFRIVGLIQPNGQLIFLTEARCVRDIHGEREISPIMRRQRHAVQPEVCY